MNVQTLQPSFQTARFALRPVRPSDVTRIEHYTADLRLARQTVSIPHPLPAGLISGFIERAMAQPRDADVWVMDGGAQEVGDEVMGVITLSRLDRNQAEIGYWVAPPFGNSHVASDAVQALVAGNPLGSSAIFASVFQDNPASARVLINAGFAYLGDAEVFCLARNAIVPTWTYSLKLR